MSKFQLLTKNGYDAFEVLSAMQKSIRRWLTKESIYRAFEMLGSEKSKDYSVRLWKRLCVCIVEDCDRNDAIPEINSLREMYFFVKKSWSDSSEWLLFVCRAVEILCSSWKWRDTTFRCLLNDTIPKMEIPEFALDPHTYRGKQKRKKEWKTRKDRVIEQQNSLEPTSKPTKTLYHEVLDQIDWIMAKKKKPIEESWTEDGWLFS
jgi:hypothetical protein